MSIRLAPSHAIFLALALALTFAMNRSAIAAKFSLNNLIILAPASLLAIVLVAVIVFSQWGREEDQGESQRKTAGDILLLALFCGFCGSMFYIGFDVATFFFVWLGIVICGERSLWKPPLFSLVFTATVTSAFGALFPFPMPTLVF
ncbi:tripartite tricarboxylate transporter TctB family protein [Roseibium aggregatum]|uniref:tripartite tricarboxylate transporter TctB family protein n=1 Tax=Roseibium aggregatum TaxID=187304 RepID=UPI0025AC3967|nr:tripartite tricarboxylate transporter TctB family protein [Roseibium aggregatum]WJS05988.1 tripartite tricarboxylate transporter TctB family protein [Roseibium aggregatum]